MDGDTFRTRLEAEKRTELDRLGSQQLLLALTEADLSTRRILDVAAASEHAARETFRQWAESESDEAARDAFRRVAEQEDEHLRRVTGELDGSWDPDAGAGPMHSYLRERDATVERVAGGMVARTLVSERTHNQIIGFFVNEADRSRADLFRELKAETRAVTDEGVSLLERLCGDEDDWETARTVAEYTVQLAYDDYADALRGLGFDPRSIC
jgi:hypothetical protein